MAQAYQHATRMGCDDEQAAAYVGVGVEPIPLGLAQVNDLREDGHPSPEPQYEKALVEALKFFEQGGDEKESDLR